MTLPEAIFAANLSEIEAMNLLQSEGAVSDNCVWAGDVAAEDVGRAVEWVSGRTETKL